MAIIIGKRTNLDAPIKVESLNGVTFTSESEAHQFVVRCEQRGQELTLAGTISAKFIRADGNTIQLVGSIVDGAAVVTLAQDCYNVQGRFQLSIFNTVGDTTLCVYSCVGTVQRAQSGNLIDGGGIIPSVEDLIADIEEARQSIPPTYTKLVGAIAPEYTESTYGKGAYVWHDGDLYQSKVAIATPEEWTASHWLMVVLTTHIRTLEQLPDRLSTDEEVLNNLLPTVDHFMTPSDYEKGRYINARTGAVFTPADDFCTTDYINVSGFRRIAFDRIRLESTTIMQENVDYRTIDVSNLGMSFYDANKNPIGFTTAQIAEFDSSQERGYAENMSILQVPIGAVYARFTKLRDYDTYGGFSLIGTTAGEANESNIKSIRENEAVRYDEPQNLNAQKKAQARANIGLTFTEVSDGVIVVE